MRGEVVLRACMLGLVLVNLVFVQLTEATSLSWLLPLYALTLLAPLLGTLRERVAYRALWNLGVLGVFVVLVRHASSYDLRYVLQDGLILAALCQVHLLNNLRPDQRPDLLFWNSFLIAVATGYLSQDLIYPFAFLVYVPLYVVGLQLLCVTRSQRSLQPRATARVVRDGLRHSAVLLAVTMAVFLFWPRDFRRPSFLTTEFDFDPSGGALDVAFSDRLKLGRKGRARASDRVVMEVSLIGGDAAQVPALWRGATLGSTDGERWWPLEGGAGPGDGGDLPWLREGDVLSRPGPLDRGAVLAVEHQDAEVDRLFVPLEAERVALGEGIDAGRVATLPDGTLQYGEPKLVRPTVHYELTLPRATVDERGGRVPAQLERGLARYLALPRSRRVESARALARRLAAQRPGAEQHELVAAFSRYLERRYAYLPPGTDGAARSLEEFLAGESGGGHCEFFASALATMLRSQGVPCRVVTGYRSREWDAARRTLTLRRRHAHAWVEVHDPRAGWYAVDPTPAAAGERGASLWGRVRAALDRGWSVLAGFDAERREAALTWAAALPGRAWRAALRRPLASALALAGAVLALVALRRLRSGRVQPGVLRYRRALRRAGLQLVGGETPCELLDRARGDGLGGERLRSLEEATRAHERERYAA